MPFSWKPHGDQTLWLDMVSVVHAILQSGWTSKAVSPESREVRCLRRDAKIKLLSTESSHISLTESIQEKQEGIENSIHSFPEVVLRLCELGGFFFFTMFYTVKYQCKTIGGAGGAAQWTKCLLEQVWGPEFTAPKLMQRLSRCDDHL